MIERQVEHLTRLVDDLLDVSRITRGKIELQRERRRLPVRSWRARSRPPAADRRAGTPLELDLPDEPVSIEGDRRAGAGDRCNLLTTPRSTPSPAAGSALTEARGPGRGDPCPDTGIGIAPDMPADLRPVHAGGASRSAAGRAGHRADAGPQPRRDARRTRRRAQRGVGRGSEFVVRLPVMAPQAPPRRVRAERGAVPRRPARGCWSSTTTTTPARRWRSCDSRATRPRSPTTARRRLAGGEAFEPDVVLLDHRDAEDGRLRGRRRAAPRGGGVKLIALTG